MSDTRKDQDKLKCLACIDKISTKLGNLGLSFFMTSDRKNILCKTYGTVSFDGIVNNESSNTGATTCPHSTSSSCPHTVCKYPKASCHYHNAHNIGNNSNNTDDDTNKLPDKFTGCLFRITPTDIYNGIFLHAIKLHGETCDLKMTFNYDEAGATELVNIIKFLVK